MLGLGNFNKTGFINNLVQIGTGEGKSVTIAVTAIILAILGFDVSCACYSEYLSKRDKAAFHKLFEFLEVDQFITYGDDGVFDESIAQSRFGLIGISERLVGIGGEFRRNGSVFTIQLPAK